MTLTRLLSALDTEMRLYREARSQGLRDMADFWLTMADGTAYKIARKTGWWK